MKSLKILLSILIIGTTMVSCKDDDDSMTVTPTSLVGDWKGFEIINEDDGLTYKLNENIPFIDSVQGCPVFDYRISYAKLNVSFSNDSVLNTDIIISSSERDYTFNNVSTCDISYDPWEPSEIELYQETSKYYTINNKTFVVLSMDSVFDNNGNFTGLENFNDTSTYSIDNGILIIDGAIRLMK